MAGIVSFKFKDFNASVEDLSTCVKLDKDNASAYTYLVSVQHLQSCPSSLVKVPAILPWKISFCAD